MTSLQRFTTLIAIIAATVGLGTVRAQDYADVGLKATVPFSSSDIDHVDLSTGNVVGTIPLVSYPQLGQLPPLTFSAVFNTTAWYIEATCDPYGDQCVAYYVTDYDNTTGSYALGASVQSSLKGFRLDSITYETAWLPNCPAPDWPDNICSAPRGANAEIMQRDYTLVDPSGASHTLLYDTSNPNWVRALDGSGYSLYGSKPYDPSTAPGGVLYTSSGNTISYTNEQAVITETDPAGNSMSTGYFSPNTPAQYHDSIGRQFNDPVLGAAAPSTNGCPNLGDPNQPIEYAMQWNAPGPNGGTMPFLFCYTGIAIQPMFFSNGSQGSPGCDDLIASMNQTDEPGSSWTVIPSDYAPGTDGYVLNANFCNEWASMSPLQSIVLPNGRAWSILYDVGSPYSGTDPVTGDPATYFTESYGAVKEIFLPTGGTISYSYANRYSDLTDELANMNARVVTSRAESDGLGNTSIKYFSYSKSGTLLTTTETTSDGNVVHYFSGGHSIGSTQEMDETALQYFQGAVSGAPLKEVDTTYNASPGTTVSPILPSSITTRTPAGITSVTRKTYSSPFSVASYSCYSDSPPVWICTPITPNGFTV